MVGEIISERRATSNRNGGRDHSGIVGDIERNQHLTALVNWNTIQDHQNLLAWWPVIVIPLTVYLAFRVGRSSQIQQSTSATATAMATLPSVEPPKATAQIRKFSEVERFALDDDSIFIEKKTVKLGDYWEIREGMSRLKITPVAFKEGDSGRPFVELKIDTGGSMFYGGDGTIKSGVNRVALPETSSGFQVEKYCAYQFSFSEQHVHFSAFRVDHINKFANEVVLEACAVALRKRT